MSTGRRQPQQFGARCEPSVLCGRCRFDSVFDKKFEGLVLDRHDANADLINRVFKDTETTAFFTQMARTIVYELARQSGQAG